MTQMMKLILITLSLSLTASFQPLAVPRVQSKKFSDAADVAVVEEPVAAEPAPVAASSGPVPCFGETPFIGGRYFVSQLARLILS